MRNGIDLSDVFLQVWGIDYLARVEYESGDLARAGILAGAVEAAREEIGGGWGPESVGLDTADTLLRRDLGPDEAKRVISPGREAQSRGGCRPGIGESPGLTASLTNRVVTSASRTFITR